MFSMIACQSFMFCLNRKFCYNVGNKQILLDLNLNLGAVVVESSRGLRQGQGGPRFESRRFSIFYLSRILKCKWRSRRSKSKTIKSNDSVNVYRNDQNRKPQKREERLNSKREMARLELGPSGSRKERIGKRPLCRNIMCIEKY